MDPTPLMVDLGERSYPIVIGNGLLAGEYDLAASITGVGSNDSQPG